MNLENTLTLHWSHQKFGKVNYDRFPSTGHCWLPLCTCLNPFSVPTAGIGAANWKGQGMQFLYHHPGVLTLNVKFKAWKSQIKRRKAFMAASAATQDVTCYILLAIKTETWWRWRLYVFVGVSCWHKHRHEDAGRSCQTPHFPFSYMTLKC